MTKLPRSRWPSVAALLPPFNATHEPRRVAPVAAKHRDVDVPERADVGGNEAARVGGRALHSTWKTLGAIRDRASQACSCAAYSGRSYRPAIQNICGAGAGSSIGVGVVQLSSARADRVHPELPRRRPGRRSVRGQGRCRAPSRAPTAGTSGTSSSSPSSRDLRHRRRRARSAAGAPKTPAPRARPAPAAARSGACSATARAPSVSPPKHTSLQVLRPWAAQNDGVRIASTPGARAPW